MRLITTKTIILACIATACAHLPRTFGPLVHNHGPDCVHPPLFNALRPSYYTIPGYDLIIPAEEIDGPQHNVIYNGLPPLEPIVFQPEEEVPLQKFVPLPVPVAPAPCNKEKSLEALSNAVSELASHLHKPALLQPLPPPPPVVFPPCPLPAPVLVPDYPAPVVIAPPPAPLVAIAPPPVLPEAPILPPLPLPLAPAPPCPIVRTPEFIEPAVVLPPAPPVFVDVTPKPFFVNPPPPAPFPQPFGPVEVHQNKGGYSYKLINNLAFQEAEHKKADNYQHVVKHVVKITEPPFVTPAPIPRPVVPFFELPPPPALPAAPLLPVAIKAENLEEIKENPIPVSGNGFSYHQHNVDGSVTSYDGAKAHQTIELRNPGPLFSLPTPPAVFLPARSDVEVNIKKDFAPVADRGFSYRLGNESVTAFEGHQAHQTIELRKPGPLFSLPTPPAIFAPAKSNVEVIVKENLGPVAGSGYSYSLHNGDGSVTSFGGSRKEAVDIGSRFDQAVTFGLPALPRPQIAVEVPVPAPAPAIFTPLPSVAVPAPPSLPGLIEIPSRFGQSQAINGHAHGGYSYNLINNALEKSEAKAQSGGSAAFVPEQPKLEHNARPSGFVYKSFQKDGSVTTYTGASPATENISGPSPLKIMVNRINELCNGRGIKLNGGYNYAEKASAVTVSPLHIPAPPALPTGIFPAFPNENIQAASAKGGYSYKLVNNGAFINDDFQSPRLTPTPGPVVHITSRPVTVTQGSAAKSGFKFSYSSPYFTSSSSGETKTNFVSTTVAPVPAFSESNGGYNYAEKASAVTVSPLNIPAPPALPSGIVPVFPSGNIQAASAKGYSYKLVNNGAFINDDFQSPRLTPTPGPVVHITSRPVTVTQGSAEKSGFKFSYSSPSFTSSSSGATKTNFVSTTVAPVSAFSEPIVVPDQGGYSYRKTNLDGSTLKVDSDQKNQVTVSVDDSGRGDIPMMGVD